MPVKLVTIDFWNTLFDSSNGRQRNAIRQKALINEIDKIGVMVKQDQYDKAMKASWEFFNNIWRKDQRTPEPVETVRFFWNYLKLPESEDCIANVVRAFSDSILDHPPKLLPGVKSTLPILSERYEMGIVSDTGFSPGSVLKILLDKEDILKYFGAFSFSDETCVSKPHPKAFNTILRHFDIKPAEGLHIGDIELTDIVGAKAIGMKAIRFSGDDTGIFLKENPRISEADAESKSWKEIPDIISRLSDNK
ncbi:MAG: HAD family hydrolase [Candidatus Kapaibacterium sp.]